MERIIKRGDIFYATLNPVIGSEQGGTRPVLTISNNTGNRHSPTIIVAPITSRTHTKAKLPTHTEVKDFDKLDKDSIILLEQIHSNLNAKDFKPKRKNAAAVHTDAELCSYASVEDNKLCLHSSSDTSCRMKNTAVMC